MSHSYLSQYVEDRINFWNRLMKRDEMTFPLSDEDVRKVVYHLEGDLSPENLHCDGEISNAEAQRKYNFYMKVFDELEANYNVVYSPF